MSYWDFNPTLLALVKFSVSIGVWEKMPFPKIEMLNTLLFLYSRVDTFRAYNGLCALKAYGESIKESIAHSNL